VSERALPHHPRLAERALARRHVIDGKEQVVIHDSRTGNLVRMEPRVWALIASADGSRDLDGLILAAARRGALRRRSELVTVLEELHRAGLLEGGIAPRIPVTPSADRPLEPLAGFSLTCDASGACCAVYGTVRFSSLEAARARVLLPDLLDGGANPERVFLPTAGVGEDEGLAVTLVDNRCAYLGESGRCRVHELGGEHAKPEGCRIYPATFVDDGEVVRVSVGVECACVLESVGKTGGAPLVPAGARARRDLGPAARVVVLAESIVIHRDTVVTRGDYVAWSRLVEALGWPEDPVPSLVSLARAIGRAGLAEAGSRAAIASPEPLRADALLPWIEALAERAQARVQSASSWRSARDRSLLASRWIEAAARSLLDRRALQASLDAPPPDPAAEAFTRRAFFHGHQGLGQLPLAEALVDRAVRFVVARALGSVVARECPSDAAARHPLALLEAMLRGHGLSAYAHELRLPASASSEDP
jgi:lysine-N-methylase